jgi:hypothetical protein
MVLLHKGSHFNWRQILLISSMRLNLYIIGYCTSKRVYSNSFMWCLKLNEERGESSPERTAVS